MCFSFVNICLCSTIIHTHTHTQTCTLAHTHTVCVCVSRITSLFCLENVSFCSDHFHKHKYWPRTNSSVSPPASPLCPPLLPPLPPPPPPSASPLCLPLLPLCLPLLPAVGRWDVTCFWTNCVNWRNWSVSDSRSRTSEPIRVTEGKLWRPDDVVLLSSL